MGQQKHEQGLIYHQNDLLKEFSSHWRGLFILMAYMALWTNVTRRQLTSMTSKERCLGTFNLKLLFNINKLFFNLKLLFNINTLFFLELIRGGLQMFSLSTFHILGKSQHLSYPIQSLGYLLFNRSALLKLSLAEESPGDLVKMQVLILQDFGGV